MTVCKKVYLLKRVDLIKSLRVVFEEIVLPVVMPMAVRVGTGTFDRVKETTNKVKIIVEIVEEHQPVRTTPYRSIVRVPDFMLPIGNNVEEALLFD